MEKRWQDMLYDMVVEAMDQGANLVQVREALRDVWVDLLKQRVKVND